MVLGWRRAREGSIREKAVVGGGVGTGNQGVRGAALLDGAGCGRSNTRPPSGGQVAQLVEQRTENPRVGGSIPPLATINPVSQYARQRQHSPGCAVTL